MKSSHAQTALALFVLFTLTSLSGAQDSAVQPAAGYTYRTVNAPGASNTLAYAINDSGEIVGYITGGECAATSDQASCGFVDAKGKFTTVACALDGATDFFDVDDAGEVIGAVSLIGGVGGIIWEGNEACSGVGPSGPSTSEAWGVSVGNVVGYYINSDGNFEGYSYNAKTQEYANVTCDGWADTRAYGINADGVIVGDVSNSTSGPFEALTYKDGKCTTFTYPKAVSTSAKGINKSGEISGWYTDTTGKFHGFVKTGSKFAALNYPKATATLAYHLNNNGLIAGAYADSAGTDHGFIATPKPAAQDEGPHSEPAEDQ